MLTVKNCGGGWCKVDYGRFYGYVAQNNSQVITSRTLTSPPPAAPRSVYYSRCTDARAAGAAPIKRGQPAYWSVLDRYGDGIACE